VVPLLKKVNINGIVHITGGGILENIPRVLPNGLTASITLENWKIPEVFNWLSRVGRLTETEMLKTFNCGVGLVLITNKRDEEKTIEFLDDIGENVIRLGNVVQGSRIKFKGTLL
jgi:phosphoribosylformylglycinamidine cyclo-ligase